uniref:(northern house mosquito) hypothetical protein n=1 Tax=Culex pipiens TaxID=7175 RepID=A0A8D8BBZ7_CULPI
MLAVCSRRGMLLITSLACVCCCCHRDVAAEEGLCSRSAIDLSKPAVMAHLELLLLTVVAPSLFAELLLAPGADGEGTRISCYRRLHADDRQPQLTIRWFLTTMSRLVSVLPASSPRKFRTSANMPFGNVRKSSSPLLCPRLG